MMVSIENRARLAFALVVVLAIVVGLAWYFYTASQYTTYQIVTQDSVSGLIVDAPVEFHGVEVGKVTSVELTNPNSVTILLNIRKEVPITTATIATITARGLATRGFTGYVYVAMENSADNTRSLLAKNGSPYPQIRTAPSHSVNLDTTINQLNENVQYVTDTLRSVLDENTVASLKQSVDSLQQVTHMLADNTKKLNAIILNTKQASDQFNTLLESSGDTVRTVQFQLLPEAYRTLDKLDKLSDSLNGVAGKINREPSILLRGAAQPPPGPGESK
ncbi:MAG TPA: MlaD family protein [Gammaproteobacteria bacterium]